VERSDMIGQENGEIAGEGRKNVREGSEEK
jgi:hypothetical protein